MLSGMCLEGVSLFLEIDCNFSGIQNCLTSNSLFLKKYVKLFRLMGMHSALKPSLIDFKKKIVKNNSIFLVHKLFSQWHSYEIGKAHA